MPHASNKEYLRGFEDEYETVKVPVREAVTYGVDLAKLAEWLEEEFSGRDVTPGVD